VLCSSPAALNLLACEISLVHSLAVATGLTFSVPGEKKPQTLELYDLFCSRVACP